MYNCMYLIPCKCPQVCVQAVTHRLLTLEWWLSSFPSLHEEGLGNYIWSFADISTCPCCTTKCCWKIILFYCLTLRIHTKCRWFITSYFLHCCCFPATFTADGDALTSTRESHKGFDRPWLSHWDQEMSKLESRTGVSGVG